MAQLGMNVGEQKLAGPDVVLCGPARGPACPAKERKRGPAINPRHCTGRQYAWPNQYQADSLAASEC